MSSLLYKYVITWWQDCPNGSGSMSNFSNSHKQGLIKKQKTECGMLNSKGYHAGNYLNHENCTQTTNLPYYTILRLLKLA